jgi:hypothetical protein
VHARDDLVAMLRVRASDGTLLAPCSHVSAALGSGEIEVAICGLDADLYERHFPRHLADYARRFAG